MSVSLVSLVRSCDWCSVSGGGVGGSSFVLWDSVGLADLFSAKSDFGDWGCSGDLVTSAIRHVGWVSDLQG